MGDRLELNRRLVVSDLDGTLLTPEHRVGEYTLRVFRGLRNRGLNLLLASGRHHQDIRAVSTLLGSGVYTISSNGAAVYDGKSNVVEMTALEPACLKFLLSDPAFYAVHTNLYCAHDWLVERPEPRLLSYHVESAFSYRVVDFCRLDPEPVLKVFYYGEHSELLKLERYIRERCEGEVATTFALPFTLEVMARGVSKGAALERVCKRLRVDPAEVVAFGDGLNDLEMLRAAGSGVLMGNADPRLKAALPECPVIGENADEAVARYLAERFAESRFASPTQSISTV